jgi:hypothetical protein
MRPFILPSARSRLGDKHSIALMMSTGILVKDWHISQNCMLHKAQDSIRIIEILLRAICSN